MAIAQEQSTVSVGTSDWTIDPAASAVEFSVNKRLMFVKHLVIRGRFADLSGAIGIDAGDPSRSHVQVTIGAASIDTGHARRDTHLKGTDFFHTERFPTLRFASTGVEGSAGRYRVTGNLTVRDVTRPVTLDVQQERTGDAARFTATTVLNRRDFGLSWDRAIVKIADEIRISIDITARPS